jgi:hypothetical protein
VEIGHHSVFLVNSVLEGSFVESHRWEFGEAWMHPVLDLESDRSDPEAYQPLKETLVKSCFSCLLTHDNWA